MTGDILTPHNLCEEALWTLIFLKPYCALVELRGKEIEIQITNMRSFTESQILNVFSRQGFLIDWTENESVL